MAQIPSDLEKALQARFAKLVRDASPQSHGAKSNPYGPHVHPRALPRNTWPHAETLVGYGPFRGQQLCHVSIADLVLTVQDHIDSYARDPDALRRIEEHIGYPVPPPPKPTTQPPTTNMNRQYRPHAHFVMATGNFQGQELWTIPEDYLVGVLFGGVRSPGNLAPSVRAAIEMHLNLKMESFLDIGTGTGTPGPRAGPQHNGGSHVRAVVKTWYGQLSRKFHPDLGGTALEQSILNECRTTLLKLLEAAGL